MIRVLVLMKQVPASATLGVDPETGSLIRNGETLVNPADERALSLALALPDAEITVVTMGPAAAQSLLRTAAAYPVSKLVLICDRAFAGSDTYQTARTLSRAIDQLGEFDLILCGRRAVDGETGQVGPELSTMRRLPFVPDAMALRPEGSTLFVSSQDEESARECSVPLPCVVSVCEGAPPLRPASILGMRRAAKKPITILDNDILQLEGCGLAASPTRVLRTKTVEPPRKKARRTTDADEGVRWIVNALGGKADA